MNDMTVEEREERMVVVIGSLLDQLYCVLKGHPLPLAVIGGAPSSLIPPFCMTHHGPPTPLWVTHQGPPPLFG